MLLAKDISALEYDPKAQYRFNRSMVVLWMINMPAVPILHWLVPHVWVQIEFIYVTEISLWALVEGHFGNMSSSLAAIKAMEVTKATAGTITDISEDVDDIHEVTDQVEGLLPWQPDVQ